MVARDNRPDFVQAYGGSFMRPRPRSIRARDTLLASLLSGVVLSVLGIGAIILIRDQITNDVFNEVQRTARKVSADVRAGTARTPLVGGPGVHLIQVVDSSGRVVNATIEAKNRPPLSTFR